MDASQVRSDVSRDEFRELAGEVRELQRRVSALEHHTEPAPLTPPPPLPEVHVSADLVPTLGRALLAIAGAYLLRALTEWHVVPPTAGAIAGMLYAGFWLWRAVRVTNKVAAIFDAITAAVIFAPLIWETTLNLHSIPAWGAAAAIVAFSIAPVMRKEAVSIASAAGSAIAIVLLIATHDLLPFTIALLAIAAASDWSTTPLRWFAALCADAAVVLFTMIVAKPLPEGYAAVSVREAIVMQAALLAIFAGSVVLRTAGRGGTITIYEIGQTVAAFAVSIGGVLYLTGAQLAVGSFALAASAACYAIAIRSKDARNVQTYAAFGGLLAISGILLVFSGDVRVAALSILAIAATHVAAAAIHAPAFLWVATWISGVAPAGAVLMFSGQSAFPRTAAVILLAAGATAYLRLPRKPVLAAFTAAAPLWCAAGLAASLGAEPAALIVFAVALAWTGRRWKRPELIWLMYASMIVAGAKIVLHDFSHHPPASLVISLLVYGAGLIALPRILQRS
ncbi:MAG: hypothetical protein LAO79_13415 [Acidobacteriia bacterium]|nr:hypothetical protein [Terriglobia bacterium]